ncbi:MAG TPA: hypothetical protein VMZ27_02595 [Candidatus Saccharimonadales bacterium]|nr:hypothetical protein [Candidatus Saccharimonadales bacterium]
MGTTFHGRGGYARPVKPYIYLQDPRETGRQENGIVSKTIQNPADRLEAGTGTFVSIWTRLWSTASLRRRK